MNQPRPSYHRFLPPLLVIALYVSALAFTNAHYMADSGGYVVSILAYAGVEEYVAENPVVADYRSENSYWDFGHLLWRPLGLLLYSVFTPVSSLVVGPDPGYNARILLMWVNYLAGLLSAVLLYALIDRLTGRRWLGVLVSVLFIFSNGFLNFAQGASSYVAGLACVVVALYLLLKDKGRPSSLAAIGAGLACTAAVSVWALYILVVPGIILAPLVLFGPGGTVKASIVRASASFVIASAIAFGVVMAAAGVNTPSEVLEFIAASSHGIHTSGLARMVFGFPRSFIHMGNDGILFKRFLLNDPFNPVSAMDLVRLSLWKLALFYLASAAVVIGLLVSRSWRMLVWLAIAALPLLLFAIKFDGGAIERYIPIYPAIFIALAWVLNDPKLPRLLKIVPVVFFGFAVLVNATVMARAVLNRQKQTTETRISAVIPQLNLNSWVVTSHLQDDLVNFQISFPFEPVNYRSYHIYPLLVLNSDQIQTWREEFAQRMLEAWDKGGDAWISTRMFHPKPEASWNWVEGDDPRVRWEHLHAFFTQFDTGPVAGGADGFVRLEKSEKNRQLLNAARSRAGSH
ncbi:MAG TPA: hypothetical protein VFR78_05465 [Pyrinomonadaceae bacterium]|nr:hypothetical protein [Pyrinomonadaceae bacterium]